MRVWFYFEDRERTLDSPTDKIMLSLTAYADELEREKARQRTYDAMRRKALAGQVTGGRVFGYDNVRTDAGPGGFASSTRLRRPSCGASSSCALMGMVSPGLRSVSTRRAPCRRGPNKVGLRAWAPSSVHEVLARPLYRGRVVWNRTRKRDQWGQHRQHARPEEEWLEVDAPELRLVSESLWRLVQDRREERRARYFQATGGKRFGRPPRDVDSKYLLPGFARCARCGGGMCVRSRSHGGHRAYLYGCTSYWKRGRTVCPNSLEIRMGDADAAVLAAVSGAVLAPDVVDEVVAGALAALGPEQADRARRGRQRERAKIEAEMERLTDAIAAGGELPSLLGRLKRRQAERDALDAERDQIVEPIRIDPRLLERSVRTCLDDWRGLLTRQTRHGRDFLRTVLTGPIAFTPLMDAAAKAYQFDGEASIGQLLSGVIELPTNLASPTGFNPFTVVGAVQRVS